MHEKFYPHGDFFEINYLNVNKVFISVATDLYNRPPVLQKVEAINSRK